MIRNFIKKIKNKLSVLNRLTIGTQIPNAPMRTIYMFPHYEDGFTSLGIVLDQPDLQKFQTYAITEHRGSPDEQFLRAIYRFLIGLESIHMVSGTNHQIYLPLKAYVVLCKAIMSKDKLNIVEGILGALKTLNMQDNAITIEYAVSKKNGLDWAQKIALIHIGKGGSYLS